jgi:hypothetical protein
LDPAKTCQDTAIALQYTKNDTVATLFHPTPGGLQKKIVQTFLIGKLFFLKLLPWFFTDSTSSNTVGKNLYD